MGYRVFLLACVLVLMGGCAAFDHNNDSYTGFSPDQIPIIPGVSGPYTGYYSGTMTADANSCVAVSDQAGTELPLAFEVKNVGDIINAIFEDGAVAASTVSNKKVVLLVGGEGIKHIYHLTFGDDGTITGDCKVIEIDSLGEYGDACASYTITLEKGERPEKAE
jgi:hypothetical protein